MFKHVTIHLTEPICNCVPAAPPEWSIGISRSEGGPKPFLTLRCLRCQTRLDVPNEKFGAKFEIDSLKPSPEPGLKLVK